MAQQAPRRRGRPPRDASRPGLSRPLIAERGLAVAGAEGFRALTMRRLAEELGVTVRALYNFVDDRQDVIDLVAGRMIEELPRHDLDPADWRASLRRLYERARAVYRRFPRALLVSLDETVTPSSVHPERILDTERLLRFLTSTGLTLERALLVRGQFLLDVFAFALLIDHNHDRLGPELRGELDHPVPGVWLDAHPDLDAPLARAARQIDTGGADALFESMVERAIRTVEDGLAGSG